MEIRFLQPDDANEWWRLRLESLQGDPEAFSSSPEDHQSLTLEDVRKRLGSQDADFFVVGALEDGRVIGMAGFYREKGRKTPQRACMGCVRDAAETRRGDWPEDAEDSSGAG